jgi:hypothetical protein
MNRLPTLVLFAIVGGGGFLPCSTITSARSLLFQMTDPSPTALAIFKAVRASLRLASSSSELLTIAQLLALKGDLRETLAIISSQIRTEESGTFANNFLKRLGNHSHFTDDHKVIIDLSDWESASDEEEGASAMGGNTQFTQLRSRSLTAITGSEDGNTTSRALVFSTRWHGH